MKLQTIQIHHPDNPVRTAVLNIWFMDNGDIVIGGIGWYERFDYDELQKEKEEKQK